MAGTDVILARLLASPARDGDTTAAYTRNKLPITDSSKVKKANNK